MRHSSNRGLVGIIVIIIVAILTLSYFNIDLKSVAEKPQTQQNIEYATITSKTVWDKYMSKPATYIWNTIVVEYIWKSFLANMIKIDTNQPTSFEQQAPTVQTQ
jgi:hypothetical protein